MEAHTESIAKLMEGSPMVQAARAMSQQIMLKISNRSK